MKKEYTKPTSQVVEIIKAILLELSHRKESGYSMRLNLEKDCLSIDQEIDDEVKVVMPDLPFDSVIELGPDVIVDLVTNPNLRKK
jgi:uncharacterized cysteine cluster protein YcgN (CxxCxxCC family)